ncbi:hypothetical protein OE749_13155 [Aestuariibacter sp. AA17]|uniref:Dienelactone hydrolase n=1 Tax=Fluctibacter corallii TaxID=2984329 RepID=A0ABT3AAI2_9ALTE|nr:hypothetical protein [Aestuariibacter sp. AA17]MCV2885639.1 hypothetical protein [Aestuariibacter sp. AA17]
MYLYWIREALLLLLIGITSWSNQASAASLAQESRLPEAEYAAKKQHVTFYDNSRARPVRVTLWYPKKDGACRSAHLCLSEEANTERAFVLSHGSMGSADDYDWVGNALARRGYVVVGISHFGESWVYGQDTVDHATALKLWLRPQDVSFVLHRLERNVLPDDSTRLLFSQPVNWRNITAIGHSAGGSTALMLAGARYAPEQLANYCSTEHAQRDRSCAYLQYFEPENEDWHPIEQDFTDSRVTALMLLDPALGHITARRSLEQLSHPALIVGAKNNDFLYYPAHGQYIADTLNHSIHMTLEDEEGHFVFLDACNHSYTALGVALCIDKEGVSRDAVQARVLATIDQFLVSTFFTTTKHSNLRHKQVNYADR